MSVQTQTKKITAPDIEARIHQKPFTPITCLTAYDASEAKLLDGEVDILLVGDSLNMVVLGRPDTLSLSEDEMAIFGRAVTEATKRSLVTVDMPYGSYQVSDDLAKQSAVRMIQRTGADSLKYEFGRKLEKRIRGIIQECEIPIMGHVGLRPQAKNVLGGFRAQGRSMAQCQMVLDDAQAAEQSGCFALVLECVDYRLAEEVVKRARIPVIGIGAGPSTHGQVLVTRDLLKYSIGPMAKFVRPYADLHTTIKTAVRGFVGDVHAGKFPGPAECYKLEKK